MSWHSAINYCIYRILKYVFGRIRECRRPKPCVHGTIGSCKWCESERAERNAAAQPCPPEAVEAARQRHLLTVYNAYNNIEVSTRERLRAIALERIQRLDLITRPGQIEEAVVRMHERSQRTDS